ncbi:MAG TPA: GNAT family N-acetyltransferase [Rhizomicrobium sp.]
MKLEHRIATPADLPQIADLRWRLRVDDQPVSDRGAYDRFVADFIRICSDEWRQDEMVHWIAADGEHVLAVMSIAIIRKLPSPENLRGRWGYLTNSYVLPQARNAGVGQQLLAAIEAWARAEDLELLLVWPSERAYPFYERAGFRRYPDPLVLRLRAE